VEQSDYKLIRQVGAGVSGAVWMADGPAGRVAMREFASPAAQGSEDWLADRAHFLQAAKQCLTLRNPKVVSVLDVVDDADGAWVASEFVEDETVESLLNHERLSLDQANRILRGAAVALDQAHRSGIVHGDLKPSNIFVGKKGVRIGDFAISPRARRSPRVEWSSAWIHPWLTPEHLVAPGTIGPRTDVYALAAIAYYMYTGKQPFSSSGDVRAAILRGQLDLPATVSRALAGGLEIPLRKAMSRDPGQRYASGAEMMGALEAGTGAAADLGEAGDKGASSNKLIYAGIGSLFVAMAVAGLLLLHRPKAPTQPPPTPAAASGPIASVVPPVLPVDSKPTKKTKAPPTKVDAGGELTHNTPPHSQPSVAQKKETRPDPFPVVVNNPGRKAEISPPPPKPPNPGPDSIQGQAKLAGVVPPDVYSNAPKGYSLAVYSRKANDPAHLIANTISFKYRDPTLGEMGAGDLKAMVLLNGPPPGKGHFLSLVWKVDGTPMDAHFVNPNTVTEFGSEPIRGTYQLMLMLDKDKVAEYTFRIMP
jgi:serine/threonine protein kinase